MPPFAARSKDNLKRIQRNVASSYSYNRKNCRRFHEYRNLVFNTSITEDQKAALIDTGKPVIEFNILEQFISRLLGEFSKHEPSIEVRPSEGAPVPNQIIQIVEGHIRHILYEANKNSCAYEVYKDLLSGGFSVIKVWTDFASPMSMKQVIKMGRVFDPTLTGFDPMARNPTKSDGRYSFEIYPMVEEEFKQKFTGININDVSFTRELDGFNWSYKNDREDKIILLAEYFEKKSKKARIVELANGYVMTDKNYEKLQAYWQKEQLIEQIPAVIGKPRNTELETICRYTLIEDQIIDYKETDWTYLPHVFIPGNSIQLTESASNTTYEMTKPYVYHARGMQDLKNFAGQALADYLENMVQHKFIVMKEAIPQEEDYLDALNNVQKANTVVVNAYSENNPDKPIPTPIREVQNIPAPPEITNTFSMMDQTAQMVLGSFDASLGINDNQLSGVAIVEGATQSNAAAFPYIVGYLQGLTQLANMIVDLIPKYLKGMRQVPVVANDGTKSYVNVNGKDQNGQKYPSLFYSQNALDVEISAGVNFSIAKNKALQQIVAMMQASPTFSEFMASEGMPQLLDNMEFHGSDIIKEKAEQWLEMKKQQPPQPNPEQMAVQVKMAELQHKAQQTQVDAEMKNMENQLKQLELQFKVQLEHLKAEVSARKSITEIKAHEIDAMTKMHGQTVKAHDQLMRLEEHEHKREMDHHESIRKTVALHHQMTAKKEGGKHHAKV